MTQGFLKQPKVNSAFVPKSGEHPYLSAGQGALTCPTWQF